MSPTSESTQPKKVPSNKKASPAPLPPPSNLQDYVDRVSALLDKSFRDDTVVLLSARGSVIASVTQPLVHAEGRPLDAKREPRAATMPIPNYFILSPRFALSNRGDIDGKVKISSRVDVEDVCGVYVRLFADTVGRFTTKCSLCDIQKSGVNLNMVLQSPALLYEPGHILRKSIFELVAEVNRSDYFARLGSTWSTNGDRRVSADGCVRFANVHIGCGLDRKFTLESDLISPDSSEYTSIPATSRSYLSEDDGTSHSITDHSSSFLHGNGSQGGFGQSRPSNAGLSEAYFGVGCFGPTWCMSATLYRTLSKWSEVHITAFQNFNRKAVVALTYQLDIHRRQTEFNLGIFRRFHLPGWGQSFVGACKVSNSGVASLLVDMEIDGHTKIGVVSRHDLLFGKRPTFGFIASARMD